MVFTLLEIESPISLKIASVLQSSVDDLLISNSTKRIALEREAALMSAAESLNSNYFSLLVTATEAFARHQRTDAGL
ncbi:hypothetical protein [Sinorhizobium medicae]